MIDLEQKSRGMIKSSYFPKNLLTNPNLYSEYNPAYYRVDSIIKKVSRHFPSRYREDFRKRASMQNGLIIYENFDKWHAESRSQILVTLDCSEYVAGLDGKLYLPYLYVLFTFHDYHDIISVLNAFEKEFIFNSRQDYHIIQRLDNNGRVLSSGIDTLKEIFGNGKSWKMIKFTRGGEIVEKEHST